jgi:hypothetical protein
VQACLGLLPTLRSVLGSCGRADGESSAPKHRPQQELGGGDRCHHLCQLSSVTCTVYCCCFVVDVAAAGVLEIARTGRIALTRESGVDTKFLESMRSSTRIF